MPYLDIVHEDGLQGEVVCAWGVDVDGVGLVAHVGDDEVVWVAVVEHLEVVGAVGVGDGAVGCAEPYQVGSG